MDSSLPPLMEPGMEKRILELEDNSFELLTHILLPALRRRVCRKPPPPNFSLTPLLSGKKPPRIHQRLLLWPTFLSAEHPTKLTLLVRSLSLQ